MNFDSFVSALEKRFDYYSARVLAKEAQKDAGLGDKKDFNEKDLQALVAKLPVSGDALAPILVALGLKEVPAAPEAPNATPEPAPKEEAPKEEAKASAPEKEAEKEPADDAKQDDKKDDKKEDKKDDKSSKKDGKKKGK